jgi:cysteine desulfurase / selenocysteine lyase
MPINIKAIRDNFPILHRKVYNNPLVYFDNAATTQKPQVVIDEINRFYTELNSNIHRGVHFLSKESTLVYENARKTVQQFINAEFLQEIIFTSGTTGGINLVAFSFGEKYIKEGDEILISAMEHHANIVPWQMMCQRKKAKLKVIPINQDGTLKMEEFSKMLSEKTKLVAVTHVSNVLGTINPIKEIIDTAHIKGAKVLIDGAQSIQHGKIDVRQMDCDFFVFSGHKIYGPTGIGVLYGKQPLLNEMPPYQGGGDMVDCVTFDMTTYNELPFKFEAGTTNYIGAAGMAKAIEYISGIGLENIAAYEKELLTYATKKVNEIGGLTIFGTAKDKAPVISFLVDKVHQFDTGMILDKMGIAVRTGTHCAQPLMDFYKIEGTDRASFCFYNTKEEIDLLISGIMKVKEMFS